MKRSILIFMGLLLLFSGCIVTGNLFIEILIGNLSVNVDQTFASAFVDLNDYEDYVDHREDINSVDDMGFVCRIHNSGNNAATGQVWVSLAEDIDELPKDKVLLLSGLTVAPGATKEITLNESYDYLQHFEETRDIILSEKFSVFFTSQTTPFELEIRDLVMILSVNGKP